MSPLCRELRYPSTMARMVEGECTVDLLGVSGRKALDACVKVILVERAWKKTCPRSNMYDDLSEEPKVEDLMEANHTTIDRDLLCERIPCIQKLYMDEHGAKELCGHNKSEGREATSKHKRGTKQHVIELRANDSISENTEHERLEATCKGLKETNKGVDELGAEGIGGYDGRKAIETNCDRVKELKQPVHGSGFIIHDHVVVTSKHVIKPVLNDQGEGYEVYISNATFGILPCKVLYVDERQDLAILLCQQLNLEKNGIRSLLLTNHSLSPVVPIFCFGYPLSYKGDRALAVFGKVCSQETSSDSPLVPLDCPLDSGNYGSPALCWISDQLKVVGVITQKNIHGIQTQNWKDGIKCLQESLPIIANPQIQRYQTTPLLTSDIASKYLGIHRLYDILKTHSPFCVIPGICLVDFIKTFANKHEGKHEEELREIINCFDILS